MNAAFDPWHAFTFTTSALAAVVAWSARDHVKRDDHRFHEVSQSINALGTKLDNAITQTSKNHEEILHILLEKKVS